MRARLTSEAGQRLYAQRQGVESTISQAVRAFGLRQTRYRGLAMTGLPVRADALDKRISQVEASLGALARVAAADMAVRSMATSASGAVLPQNEVSRLVTLGSSIPEASAVAASIAGQTTKA